VHWSDNQITCVYPFELCKVAELDAPGDADDQEDMEDDDEGQEIWQDTLDVGLEGQMATSQNSLFDCDDENYNNEDGTEPGSWSTVDDDDFDDDDDADQLGTVDEEEDETSTFFTATDDTQDDSGHCSSSKVEDETSEKVASSDLQPSSLAPVKNDEKKEQTDEKSSPPPPSDIINNQHDEDDDEATTGQFPHFQYTDCAPEQHQLYKFATETSSMSGFSQPFMRAVKRDLKILETSLTKDVFVKVYEKYVSYTYIFA